MASLLPVESYHRFCCYQQLIIIIVIVISDKLFTESHRIDENPEQNVIAGVNSTYLSPITSPLLSVVSFAPMNIWSGTIPANKHYCKLWIYPILVKTWNDPIGDSRARGKLIYEKKLKLKISCQTPFKHIVGMQGNTCRGEGSVPSRLVSHIL